MERRQSMLVAEGSSLPERQLPRTAAGDMIYLKVSWTSGDVWKDLSNVTNERSILDALAVATYLNYQLIKGRVGDD